MTIENNDGRVNDCRKAVPADQTTTTVRHGSHIKVMQPCPPCVEHALRFDQPLPPYVLPNALTVVGRSVVGSYSCSICRRGFSVSYTMAAAQ